VSESIPPVGTIAVNRERRAPRESGRSVGGVAWKVRVDVSLAGPATGDGSESSPRSGSWAASSRVTRTVGRPLPRLRPGSAVILRSAHCLSRNRQISKRELASLAHPMRPFFARRQIASNVHMGQAFQPAIVPSLPSYGQREEALLADRNVCPLAEWPKRQVVGPACRAGPCRTGPCRASFGGDSGPVRQTGLTSAGWPSLSAPTHPNLPALTVFTPLAIGWSAG